MPVLRPRCWRGRALVAAAAAAAAAASMGPAPQYPGLRVVYEDDFNGPLNTGIFNVLDGYVQTQYDQVCYTGDNAYTENGNLVLRTRRQDRWCGNRFFRYTSGWVDTLDKLTIRNGIMEVRAKLPYPSFRIWPAAWMISERNRRDTGLCWPVSMEIDVYEAAAGSQQEGGLGRDAICGSYHWARNGQCFVDEGRFRTGCLPYYTLPYDQDFHTYAVEFNPAGYIQWYYDGRLIYTIDRQSDPGAPLPVPDNMIVVMNTALAWWLQPPGQAPGIGDGYTFHYIDYIRLWTRV